MRASVAVSQQIAKPLEKEAIGRWASLGAIAGPVLFLLTWMVPGLLQPVTKTEYGLIGGISGAITNPISALGVGPNALLYNAAFIICGLFGIAGIAGLMQVAKTNGRGLARWSCVTLLALSPLGLALAGVFSLATSIALHNVAALLLFITPLFAFPDAGVYFRRIPSWQRFGGLLILASPLTLAFVILFIATFHLQAVAAGRGIAGLTERVLLMEIHAWYVALGWFGFRR